MPLLAQTTRGESTEGAFAFCTLQGTKLVKLDQAQGDHEHSPEELASAAQLCPACLLQHLTQTSLPVVGGLWPISAQVKDSWLQSPPTQAHNQPRFSLTPIRAPPHA